MTVFFSSHQIAEVDQIADHVALIDRGRIVEHGALDDLRERYKRVTVVFDGDAAPHAFDSPAIVRRKTSGRTTTLLVRDGAATIVERARAMQPVSIDVSPVTLKEIFLESVAEEA